MQGARAPQPGATNRPSPSGHIQRSLRPRPFSREPLPQALCGPQGALERLPAPQQPAPQRPPGAGGHGGRGTPGPIPNPEVKPASADGTAGATLWETRAPPAPGARCAGKGRGGASEHLGEGDPRGSPLSYAGPLSIYRSGLPPFFFSQGAISTPQGRWNGYGHSPSRRIEGSPCQRPFPFKGRSSFF